MLDGSTAGGLWGAYRDRSDNYTGQGGQGGSHCNPCTVLDRNVSALIGHASSSVYHPRVTNDNSIADPNPGYADCYHRATSTHSNTDSNSGYTDCHHRAAGGSDRHVRTINGDSPSYQRSTHQSYRYRQRPL